LRVRRKLPADLDSICIHRAKLIDILGSTLPARQIHLSNALPASTARRKAPPLGSRTAVRQRHP
jgi:hypothetical protein